MYAKRYAMLVPGRMDSPAAVTLDTSFGNGLWPALPTGARRPLMPAATAAGDLRLGRARRSRAPFIHRSAPCGPERQMDRGTV